MEIDKEFRILSVTREDLKNIGYDPSGVSDAMMERLAELMTDECIQYFQEDLEMVAERLDIPKLS